MSTVQSRTLVVKYFDRINRFITTAGIRAARSMIGAALTALMPSDSEVLAVPYPGFGRPDGGGGAVAIGQCFQPGDPGE